MHPMLKTPNDIHSLNVMNLSFMGGYGPTITFTVSVVVICRMNVDSCYCKMLLATEECV